MSWQATSWARDQVTGSAAAKAVLMILAEAAGVEDASCTLSAATIASRAELGRRTVVAVMPLLESRGLIARRRRNDAGGHRTSDEITLLMAETQGAADAPRTPPQSADVAPRTPAKVQMTARLGAGAAHKEGIEEKRSARVSKPMAIPDGFPGSTDIERERAFLIERGWNLDASLEAEKFRAHALTSGRTAIDWRAAFRTWVIKSMERAPAQQRRQTPASAPAARDDLAEWRHRVATFNDPRNGYWNTTDWGPKPRQPGCLAPPEILREFNLHLAAVAGAE